MQKIDNIIKSLKPTEKILFYFFSVVLSVTAIIILFRVHTYFLVEIPTHGGSFTEGLVGSARFINPILAISDTDRDISSLVYSGLLKNSLSGEIELDMASSYQVSEDGTVYNVILKPNIYFHDGKEVTADDVIFTIEKIMDPIIKSPRRSNWDGVLVEKVSDREINFVLSKPYSPFIQSLTVGILPKHIWENATPEEFPFSEFNINPIGSGPYKVKKITRNSGGIPTTIVLEAFKKYNPEKPKIKNITFRFFQNENDLIKAYSDKSVDSIGNLTLNTANNIVENKEIAKTASLPRVFGLFFNQNISPVFLNKEVREALELSTPKQKIIDEVLYGFGTPLKGPIPSQIEEDLLKSSGNIEEAKELLTRSGWKIDEEEGIFIKDNKDGKVRLSFSISTSDSPELKRTAEILKETWESMGAQVDVKIFEQSDLSQNIIKGRKYEALLFGKVVGENSDLFPFWHSSQRNDPGLNISLYANITVDKNLEELQKNSDPIKNEERKQVVIEQIINDIPAIFLFTPDMIYIPSHKIKNISLKNISSPNERFIGISDWYIETEKVWKIFQPKN